MSRLLILFAFFLTDSFAFAAGLVLEGPSFSASDIQIIWSATTNRWLTNLWIYKAVPQQFSATVISNLMSLGGFTTKDRTHVEGQPPIKDKRLLYFANKERTRYLGIYPPHGWLYYRDERARVFGKEKVKGVPSEEEALDMALERLDKLGIERSDLATKGDSPELYVARESQDRGTRDRATGEYKKEIISRGVLFIRRIDGVDFTGLGSDGGFHISFANEGKVSDLELVWRNLRRHKLCKVISPAELVQRIKKGQAKMSPITAVDTSKATKLTINKVTAYYRGESGDVLQELTYPFAGIECTLEADDGARAAIVLNAPILVDECL